MAPASLVVLVLLSTLAFGGTSARAQTGLDGAADALARSDYGEARRLANDLIASGMRTAGELAPAYEVLAQAEARLGDTEAARAAFTRLLALAPSYRMSSDQPVEVRSPYLEARGFWSAFVEPLLVRVRVADDGATLVVEVDDPGALCARVRVRVRMLHSTRFLERVQPTREPVHVPLAGLADAGLVHYSVALLDEHGNRIYTRGSDEQPEQLATRPASVPTQAPPSAPLPRERPRSFQIGGLLALTVGTGAVVAGGVENLRREQLADTWNRASCDGAGVTRGERCADERRRITTTQRAAVASYAIGAAGLIVGAVLLLKDAARTRDAPPSTARALRCQSGPGILGLGCVVEF